jgi:hypothetical protein
MKLEELGDEDELSTREGKKSQNQSPEQSKVAT